MNSSQHGSTSISNNTCRSIHSTCTRTHGTENVEIQFSFLTVFCFRTQHAESTGLSIFVSTRLFASSSSSSFNRFIRTPEILPSSRSHFKLARKSLSASFCFVTCVRALVFVKIECAFECQCINRVCYCI